MLEKAATLPADVLIYDLEDSVPAGEKDQARGRVGFAVEAHRQHGRCYVRVSSISDSDADLSAVVRPGLDGTSMLSTRVSRAGGGFW